MEYRGLTLDAFQAQAITALRDGQSVLVCAPTGTGKTIVADAVVEQALAEGRQVIYTAPVKALSNQKFRDYCALHGAERVGLVTGDLVINRDAPCLVMTTEILRNMLLGDEELDNLAAVVLDEIHFLDDRDRGTVWEEVLIYLPNTVKILGLSATLSNRDEFAEWLSEVRGDKVLVVEQDERAVPLEIWIGNREMGMVQPKEFIAEYTHWKKRNKAAAAPKRRAPRAGRGDKRGRTRERLPMTRHVELVRMLDEREELPMLYFVFSRKLTEMFARRLGERVSKSFLSEDEEQRLDDILKEVYEDLGESVLDRDLRDLYRCVIAFHHAGLHVQLKTLVERLYEQKLIKVLYTTTTFALGINMPARSVVLDDLEHYDGHGVNPMTVRGFMQMAGRAGRRGMDESGTVVVRMDFQNIPKLEPHLQRYLRGESEPVGSSFNLSFNSLIQLVERHGRAACRPIVERSFMAFQMGRKNAHLALKRKQLVGELTAAGLDIDEVLNSRSIPGKKSLKRKSQELRKVDKTIRSGGERAWQDFMLRRNFLVEIGYLSPTDELNAGANILRNIQIEEIFTTELVMTGMLEDVEPDLLFGILVAMTNGLPKAATLRYKPSPAQRNVAKRVTQVRLSSPVLSAEAITGQESTWSPELIGIGEAWAKGSSLQEIMRMISSPTDMSGQLVGGFRRAKDLASQLREAMREDEHRAEALHGLMRRVSRDEVEVVG